MKLNLLPKICEHEEILYFCTHFDEIFVYFLLLLYRNDCMSNCEHVAIFMVYFPVYEKMYLASGLWFYIFEKEKTKYLQKNRRKLQLLIPFSTLHGSDLKVSVKIRQPVDDIKNGFFNVFESRSEDLKLLYYMHINIWLLFAFFLEKYFAYSSREPKRQGLPCHIMYGSSIWWHSKNSDF